MRAERHQLRRPGKTRRRAGARRLAAGILVNVESERELARLAQHHAAQRAQRRARGSARESRLRAEVLGHEDGRRPEAVRHRRRAGAGGAAATSRRLPLDVRGLPHLLAARRTCAPSRSAKRSSKSFELALRAGRARAGAGARRSTSAAASAFPISPASSRSTSRPIGAQPARRSSSAPRASCPRPRLVIELGRYLVGEAGVYVCRVVDRKVSRGQVFLVTDGGLHHHLAASGNFGQVIRKNYPVLIGESRARRASARRASVVGPLCTPLDLLADRMELPRAESAISSSCCSPALRRERQPADSSAIRPARKCWSSPWKNRLRRFFRQELRFPPQKARLLRPAQWQTQIPTSC